MNSHGTTSPPLGFVVISKNVGMGLQPWSRDRSHIKASSPTMVRATEPMTLIVLLCCLKIAIDVRRDKELVAKERYLHSINPR